MGHTLAYWGDYVDQFGPQKGHVGTQSGQLNSYFGRGGSIMGPFGAPLEAPLVCFIPGVFYSLVVHVRTH
jgi:hypothetical protein